MLVIKKKRNKKFVVGAGWVQTISDIANIVGNVANTAVAAKKIYDTVKPAQKVLSQKSRQLLQRYAAK